MPADTRYQIKTLWISLAAIVLIGTGATVVALRDGWTNSGNSVSRPFFEKVEGCFAYTRPAKKLFSDRESDVAVFNDGRQRFLTTDGLSTNPSFSPDGKRIVFQSGLGRYADFEYGDGPERVALFTSDAMGALEQRLTDGPYDFDPDWSPDGSKVVFVRNHWPKSQELWTIEVRTGQERLLFKLPTEEKPDAQHMLHSPTWSPDGQRIAFARGRFRTSAERDELGLEGARTGGSVDLWMVNSDGSGSKRLLTNMAGSRWDSPGLAWSPDGGSIAFNGVYVWHLGEDSPRRLNQSGEWPAWSPDGQRIAYWEQSSQETGTEYRLTVSDPDGGHKQRVQGTSVLFYVYGGMDWAEC